MAWYYSASERAFFSSDLMTTGSMPADKVAVTDSDYEDLMDDQVNGLLIRPGSGNAPESASQNLTTASRFGDVSFGKVTATGLDLNGNADISGTLVVTGASTLKGALAAQGGLTTTTITATGTSTLAAVNASNITASGTLKVNGASTLKAVSATNATASGTLAVTGTSTFTGKVTANGGLTTKALTATSLDLNGAGDISGNLSVGGLLTVTGATSLTGGLQASGGVEVDDLVASSFDLNGNADISGTTLMTGKLTANGGIETKAISATTLTTSGNATVGGALTVASNLTANNIVSKSGYFGVQTASKTYYPIAVVDYDANGGFCGYRGFSGMTAIGSGESVAQLQTHVEADYGMDFGSENLFLTSDQGIWLLTNANSWDSRRTYNLVQNGLYSRLTGVTKGGNITGDNVKFFQIFLCDEASNATSSRLGGFEINTRNGSQVMLMAYKPVAGDTAYESIWIQYGTDGVVTTHSPTPPTDDSSTQIATTAWATANGFLGYKKLSSIQSVKGCFYFDNGSGVDLAEAGLDDYVGSADWYGVQYSTSTGNDKSQYVFNAGNIWRRYSDSTLGSEIWSDWIQICQANGLIAMTSQTPSAGDKSTRIATTEWVLSHPADRSSAA